MKPDIKCKKCHKVLPAVLFVQTVGGTSWRSPYCLKCMDKYRKGRVQL